MPDTATPGRDDPPESLPQISTILIMLTIFGLIGLIALFTIIAEHSVAPLEATGRRAYGPADFADQIDWQMAEHAELLANANESGDGPGGPFPVPPPPLSPKLYPCSECHDPEDEVDTERRELSKPHRGFTLNHGPEERWCFDCHNPNDRDRLRLASGELIGFEQSYRLCGQCHGTNYRDWREGIHGRRVGHWNGRKTYFLCASCHDPHKPRFQPLKPLPPPIRPQLLATRRTPKDQEHP